jgi:hypothetical protein
MANPVPHYLRPKATKLAPGPDESLEPSEPPTDPARRSVPASDWPAISLARGGTAPPEAPIAPPPTDPARRSVPASTWPTGRPRALANRPLRETMIPEPDLDPDIALWPATIVSRWPFTGHPADGIWPLGWLGVDNTGTPYVCVAAGAPGTWESIPTGPQGLSFFSGNLTTLPYTLTTTLATFMTTSPLAAGIWLVTMTAVVFPGNANTIVEVTTTVGSGTAGLTGGVSAQVSASDSMASLTFIADVVVAASLDFRAIANVVSPTSPFISQITTLNGYPSATGWTATKLQ